MSLETKIGKIILRNPMILASGVLGTSYSVLTRLYEAGLGAVVTKSIGINLRKGNPNPSVFALNNIRSLISSVGLANQGYELYREDLEILVKNRVPTVVSIFGEKKSDFVQILDRLKDLPIEAFELNFSVPNPEKKGNELGSDPEIVHDVVKTLKTYTNIPLWVKLSPNVTDIIEIASAAIKGGSDAIVAINTLKAMVIDIYTKQPILGSKRGGLSGSAIKPVGIRYIYDLFEKFGKEIPLIGVGGIYRGEDIIEYLLAGASAVEIGTSLGVAYPENMINFFQMKLKRYMKEQNYETISEIVGGAHK